jgi:cystathionine beta-synthase
VRIAIERMRANGVSQLPVCKNTPPFAAAEVAGVGRRARADGGDRRRPVGDGPAGRAGDGPALPTIGVGQKLELAVEMLHTAPALLVLSGGRPLSVLTRTDILSFFEARARENE